MPKTTRVGPKDVERMHHVRKEVAKLILQWRDNTEAAVVAGALLQNARELFELYPESVREQLVEGAVAFLEGKSEDATGVTLQ